MTSYCLNDITKDVAKILTSKNRIRTIICFHVNIGYLSKRNNKEKDYIFDQLTMVDCGYEVLCSKRTNIFFKK